MPEPAADGPAPVGEPPSRPWRRSARLLVVDGDDRALLLRAHDPAWPAFGEWWEVPGGGIEAGESPAQAAVREVLEETGVAVPAELVGPVQWHGEMTYSWLGSRHWTEQLVLVARTGPLAPPAAVDRTADEQATFLTVEWVPLAMLGRLRIFPTESVVHRLLAGDVVDGGCTRWN